MWRARVLSYQIEKVNHVQEEIDKQLEKEIKFKLKKVIDLLLNHQTLYPGIRNAKSPKDKDAGRHEPPGHSRHGRKVSL